MTERCEVCGQPGERHEICSRGSGGPVEEWNQLVLCRAHHSEMHTVGWVRFGDRWPQVWGKIQSARETMGRRTESRLPPVEV